MYPQINNVINKITEMNKLKLISNELSLYFKPNFLNRLLNIYIIIKFEKSDPKNFDNK